MIYERIKIYSMTGSSVVSCDFVLKGNYYIKEDKSVKSFLDGYGFSEIAGFIATVEQILPGLYYKNYIMVSVVGDVSEYVRDFHIMQEID